MSVSFSSTIDFDFEVNMSNANAGAVLSFLGFAGDDLWTGKVSAQDFLGRVLVAQALAGHDEGMPSYDLPSEGARMIQGARSEGYYDHRLAQLREIAEKAVADGAEMCWG